MLIRNMNQFRDVIEVSVNHTPMKRFTIPEGEDVKTVGSFFEYGESLFGLSASDGSIWLMIRGKVLKHTENLTTEFSENGSQRRLQVREKGVSILDVLYTPEKPYWNFFAMEDEDVDGFLWMYNVLSRPERKAVLLEVAARND